MTKATIYGDPISYEVQKALVAARIGGHVVSLGSLDIPASKRNNFATHVLPALEEGHLFLSNEKEIVAHFLGSALTEEIKHWVAYGEGMCKKGAAKYTTAVAGANKDPHLIDQARKELFKELKALELFLEEQEFLVGRFTYADFCVALDLLPAMKNILDYPRKDQIVNVTRWFLSTLSHNTVSQMDFYKLNAKGGFDVIRCTIRHLNTVLKALHKTSLTDEIVRADKVATSEGAIHKELSASAAPKEPAQSEKTEDKQKPPADEEAPEKAPQEKLVDLLATLPAYADEDASENKFLKKLAALSPGSFNMYAWKRCYSTGNIATKAIQFFWETFDRDTHSIWRCDFKNPKDLSLTSKSCELIDG